MWMQNSTLQVRVVAFLLASLISGCETTITPPHSGSPGPATSPVPVLTEPDIPPPMITPAVDPPLWDEFQTKITSNIQAALYSRIDNEFPNTPANLASSSTYYDGSRTLWNLFELFDDATLNLTVLESYRTKATEIIARSYLEYQFPASGYTRFPHGLYLDYISSGSQRSYDALAALLVPRSGANFIVPASVDDEVRYSRDTAYAIQVYTWADKMGIPNAHPEYQLGFVDYALSHLSQWHSGNFTNPGNSNNQFKNPFMIGLTMAALIEYYNFVHQDVRIPAAIKIAVDDMWVDGSWWPDVRNPEPTGDTSSYSFFSPGYGGFRYRLLWNGTAFVPDLNALPSSPDVNADDNMLIAGAYIWYYKHSGNLIYKTRAEDIWKGWVKNGFVGYDKQFNQGMRWTYDFVRWYREGSGDVCGSSRLALCHSSSSCSAAGGNWNGLFCQKHAVYMN